MFQPLVGIAGEQHGIGLDFSACGSYPCAWAAHDFRDRGLLENPRAQGDCRARLAETEIERVEVAIARYQQPADIGIRGEHRAQLACIEQACLRVDCVRVQLFLAGGEVAHVARLQSPRRGSRA